jgi:hypothetical protein
MTLVLSSGWAAGPFMMGYSKRVSLTDDERDRLYELLFSRQLIHLAFRICRQPQTAVTAAKKLTALHRKADTKAREILVFAQ